MDKKSGNILEKHIEKIVLVIICLISFWLLITRVILSPNSIEYQGRSFGPGEIDNYVLEKAGDLRFKIEESAIVKESYDPKVDEFIDQMSSSLRQVDTNIDWPLPKFTKNVPGSMPEYEIPAIGDVTDIELEHIRAAAYVPTEEISDKFFYTEENSKPKDIDLVTVQARFDVQQLYSNFYENFAGIGLKPEWRNEKFAEPVFAAVQLERQQLLSDGSWSDWQIINRSKVDIRREIFNIPEDFSQLPPGGVRVLSLQYKNPQITADLLQPLTYRIASSDQQWLPPVLHREYLGIQQQLETQAKRETREAEKLKREKEIEERKAEAQRLRAESKSTKETTDTYKEVTVESARKRGTEVIEKAEPVEAAPLVKEEVTFDTVYDKLKNVLIGENSKLSQMQEPIVFWANDDSVETDKTYRYRIKLGVLNPLAGTDMYTPAYEEYKNNVILWSDYSQTSETVSIPSMIHFFPVQESGTAVQILVGRYALGYWYTEEFLVDTGEMIGRAVVPKIVDVNDNITLPEEIDYSTGAVLLDIVSVNDWAGEPSLRQRYYLNMLYTYGGADIFRVPIRRAYWPTNSKDEYDKIKQLQKIEKKPLRPWDDELYKEIKSVRPIPELASAAD